LTVQPVEPDQEQSLVLRITGNLAGENAHLLKRAAEPVLISPSPPKIRLLMDGVKYIDSTGVGVIISIIRQLRDRGGILEINGLNETGLNLFHVLNLSNLECLVIQEI
jgi:anti-anti-sigma factor